MKEPHPHRAEKVTLSDSGRRGYTLRARLLIAAMCVLLGFAIVAQVRQTQDDQFNGLRQDDLVRLLDEVTQRNEQLTEESEQLARNRDGLLSGSDARAVQEDVADLLGILAGTVPVEGPGVVVEIEDPEGSVTAELMVHMLQELRNAGAEAVAVSGERLTASSDFVNTVDGVTVNGRLIEAPYEWRAIGNGATITVALDIPGGAFARMRNAGATITMSERDLVQITAVREAPEPEHASPVETED
ncbi:DUF881 domain-containing protein [Ruania alba]|uniref:Uncharacterized conserved protein YlxW, UPF0749 family n=1 Tax=Ruania alba TaxID=648782 RepID=A0A1H5G4K0_9MICO|nr:DUF881 domain-containing protein [Ruania alba]SEE10491.1 Uncharacterized conserved protein YlxW, UPF0749 family [Ruania alba]